MSDNKVDLFKAHFPDAYYFDEKNLQRLPEYLRGKGLISHEERILSTEKPGEGNMNFVRRVTTDKQSFILKQSRPWVEKYPQIKAPVERLEAEATYFKFVSKEPFFHKYSPHVLLHDPDNLILVTEDLGFSSDYTFCYRKAKKIHEADIAALLKYISHLHAINWELSSMDFPTNQALKQLNHEHIFVYPYVSDNGFDLDSIKPGLQELSFPIKNANILKKRISALGEKYLSSGPVLIHGDFYPGSWLKINQDVKVIDPEFAFFGFAEFDIGVMTAHLFMSGMKLDDVRATIFNYEKRAQFDNQLFLGFCGAEIIRRIIGLAQLPLDLTLSEKAELLDLASGFIKSPVTQLL